MFRESESRLRSSAPLRVVAALSIPLAISATERGCTDLAPEPVPSYTYEYPADYDMTCDPILESEIQQTEQVYANSWQPFELPSVEAGQSDADIVVEQQRQQHLAVAQELGLTVFDYKNEFADLEHDIYADVSSISAEQYFLRAQEFLSRYGIDLVFDEKAKDDTYTVEHTPYSYDQLVSENSLDTKRTLYTIIDNIGALPVEFVEYTGLKHLVLTDITQHTFDGQDIAGLALTDTADSDTIYVDAYVGGGTVVIHEMTHIWDANQCGPNGMSVDEQYNDLNPVNEGAYNFYADTTGYYDKVSASTEIGAQDLYMQLQLAQTDEEKAAIQVQIDAIKQLVVTADSYGMTNVLEDKATLGAQLFGDYSRWQVEASDSPIYQQKAILLATRVLQDHPEFIDYFARTGLPFLESTNVLAE